MRVQPRWADEREGTIHDLACWEPEGMTAEVTLPVKSGDVAPMRSVRTPASLEYVYTAGVGSSTRSPAPTGPVIGAFLTGLREQVLVGIGRPTAGCSCRPPSTTR